ncbi:MAG: DUF1801 domain-containing protein [Woeseia sp.]
MPKKSADDYFSKAALWGAEIRRLREACLSCGLQEELKWGSPCYTRNGKNVAGIAAFKSYFGLWFFQGALLRDDAEVLINAQEGKTRAMRQWRMMATKDIKLTVIRRYLREAAKLADAGSAIKAVRNAPVAMPEALTKALNENGKAKKSFAALRLGLRREYAEFIASAKRPETVARRLQKILPLIEKGVGLNEHYR